MKSTYSLGIANASCDWPPYGGVAAVNNQLKRVTGCSLRGCCALLLVALCGCSGVAVTTTPGADTLGTPAAADPPPPVVKGAPATAAQVGVLYSYTPAVSDALGHALTFDIANRPTWASFNSVTGELRGTPTADDVGASAEIQIDVSDGAGQATIGPFRITVSAAQSSPAPAQAPPVISGTAPAGATVGQMYSFTPTASDPNGKTLLFSIVNRPSWTGFDTSTGQLSGRPTAQNVGSFSNITISVSDGTSTASLPSISIMVSVLPPDGTPTISGHPRTVVNTGSAYRFTPTATDPRGRVLTFLINNRPPWASFNPSTGELSGTPSAGNVGSFANITISVSNGDASASLPAFTITVLPPVNTPPKISGSPATSVNVGSTYSFTPTASDPNGHALVFSIDNPPSWSNFNTNTGQLSGTPSAANVGTFANIKISVSNGTSSVSLPAFNIDVTEISTGSATISWTIPAKNTNGTPLVNLAGFTLYYGASTANLAQSVQISNPGVNTYVINNLAPGTWYFAVSDYTSSGAQSDLSNIGSKTIQ